LNVAGNSGGGDFAGASNGVWADRYARVGLGLRGSNPKAIFTRKINDFALPAGSNFTVG
jgi:hypothetical protein